MKLVILESPFAPKGRYTEGGGARRELQENLRYARLCMRDCLLRGEAPLASHLLYTQEGVLDDTKPEERKLGMRAGFEWGVHAQATVVYDDMGISEGMNRGIKEALACERRVEHRSLPGWDGWKEPAVVLSEFTPVPKCGDSGCDLPAVHCEHYYEKMRYWCDAHTPRSGHSLDQNCGPQCVALQIEVKRRLFGSREKEWKMGPPAIDTSPEGSDARGITIAFQTILQDVVEVISCHIALLPREQLAWTLTVNENSNVYSVQCALEEGTDPHTMKALKQVNRVFRSYLESREK